MSDFMTGLQAVEFINSHSQNCKKINYNILLSLIDAGILKAGLFGYSKKIDKDDLIDFGIEYGYLSPEAKLEVVEADAVSAA